MGKGGNNPGKDKELPVRPEGGEGRRAQAYPRQGLEGDSWGIWIRYGRQRGYGLRDRAGPGKTLWPAGEVDKERCHQRCTLWMKLPGRDHGALHLNTSKS